MKKTFKIMALTLFYILILPLSLYEGYYQFNQYKQRQKIQGSVQTQAKGQAQEKESQSEETGQNNKTPSSMTNIQYLDRGYYWNYPYQQKFVSFNEDGEEVIIKTDALGFRNEKIEKEADILLLGDSFISAANTKDELTFASHLRKAGWSVYNAGIDGTGTIHQAHILMDVLKHVKPKMVILNFYLGNDFRDNFYCKDMAALSSIMKRGENQKQGNQIEVNQLHASKPPLSITLKSKFQGLMNYSGVLKLIYNTVYLPIKYEGTDMSYYDRGEMMIMAYQETEKAHPDVLKSLEKTSNALVFIKQLLDENNIPLVVVGIPSKAQVMKSVREISNFDSDKKGAEFFNSIKNDLNFDKPDQILKEMCVKNHIPYVSLLAPFRKEQSQKKLFYHFDAHWNYIGQETAANEVINQLKSQLRWHP